MGVGHTHTHHTTPVLPDTPTAQNEQQQQFDWLIYAYKKQFILHALTMKVLQSHTEHKEAEFVRYPRCAMVHQWILLLYYAVIHNTSFMCCSADQTPSL